MESDAVNDEDEVELPLKSEPEARKESTLGR